MARDALGPQAFKEHFSCFPVVKSFLNCTEYRHRDYGINTASCI